MGMKCRDVHGLIRTCPLSNATSQQQSHDIFLSHLPKKISLVHFVRCALKAKKSFKSNKSYNSPQSPQKRNNKRTLCTFCRVGRFLRNIQRKSGISLFGTFLKTSNLLTRWHPIELISRSVSNFCLSSYGQLFVPQNSEINRSI